MIHPHFAAAIVIGAVLFGVWCRVTFGGTQN
jgi:hypothetical protein